MNAGRHVERLIADWLVDEAPRRAPDRLLESAAQAIDHTNQRRFSGAWRESMTVTLRGLAIAAVVAVIAIGGALVLLRPSPADTGTSSPTPRQSAEPLPSTADGVTVAAFKAARDVICTAGTAQRDQLRPRMIRVYDEAATEAERADGLAAIDDYIAMEAPLIESLAALEAPPSLRDAHVANVQQYRDVLTLVREISRRLHAGDVAGALPIDETTDVFGIEMQDWEQTYNFLACP